MKPFPARLLVLLALLLPALAAHAQAASAPALAPPGTPAAARFEDSMAQRMLACAACHGAQGRAAPDGYYPRIAGKPAGYLYNQLLNFRDGRRHYGLMTRMVDPLTDAYLWEIAQYFSALDLPYAAPVPPKAGAAVLQRGQELVRRGDAARGVPACAACHGEALTGTLPAVPGLLGLPHDYVNAQFGAWRGRQRAAHAPDCMAQIANRLAPDDVVAVATWLAAQPVPASAHPAAAPAQPMPLACGSAAPPRPAGKAEARP